MHNSLIEVIIITGPSGVGKTTVAYEVAAILGDQQISHALIDTDELDRIYPLPKDTDTLSENNLRAIWQSFADLGCSRLVLCGVMTDLENSLVWVKRALPEVAKLHPFRLNASFAIIGKNLSKREVGSQLERHIKSSKRAAETISRSQDSATQIDIQEKTVAAIANEILEAANWI